MTLAELKKLDDKYNNGLMLDFYDLLRHNHLSNWNNITSEETLAFWSKFLDVIDDENIKAFIYIAFAECIYYYEKLRDIDYDLDELSEACKNERCFIFPFAPGDFIKTKYGNPEKVVSVTMHNAYCWPVINTEKRHVQVRKEVVVEQRDINYPEVGEYHKVDNVQTYGLYNEYGEEDDYYWE